ncbi:ATP-binding protein [Desulfoluna butyratoxydans]|uniref:histidine kinase n=1 Tax=Desulfoluna butyratoxydans TaxID=231438 RepID=A0A4U8YHW1_9BACT|nr:transporter substrate-binding domain-containing protein [Desulfoluna butyratoxydans]VFQ43205.1 gaf domain [Desulfoluna butyratoxydans]
MVRRPDVRFLLAALLLLFAFSAAASAATPAAVDPLTPEERQWLTAHDGKIRLAPSPNWEPLEFFDENGRYRGLVADYMHLVEERLGFRFKVIRIDSWENVLTLARHREVDIISAAHHTRERGEFLNWSPTLFTLSNTIIVKKSVPGVLTLGRMQNMTIGVPAGYAVYHYIRGTYPDLNLVPVSSGREGMRMVSFGELDAMIMEVPNALFVIEDQQITNLRLAGTIDFKVELGTATRNDWPLLGSIMEKGLALITEEERADIYNKWVRLEQIPFYRNPTFWTVISSMFIVVAVIMAAVIAINRTLKMQVAQRTEELRVNEKRLEALLRLNQMTEASLDEIMAFAVKEAVKLTRSRFGYLAFADSTGWLFVHDSPYAAAGKGWTATCTPEGFPDEFKGFWGEALARRVPVTTNDYPASNPAMKGVPTGVGPIFRYMNIPVLKRGEVVVVAGVGNKPVPYDDADQRQVTLLMAGMWRMVQRRRSEEALKQSEKRFRDLVESALTGITIVQAGEVVYNNPEQERIMGALAPFGTRRDETIHPDDLEAVNRFSEAVMNGEPGLHEAEFRFTPTTGSKDEGRQIWVTCRANPIEFQGESAMLINTMDITWAKELEHLLVVQDKMASLGHVAAGIAHEIRNPLSGINIYMSTLEKRVAAGRSMAELEPVFRQVRSASGKIESVIRRVMNFSKPCEPKIVLTRINKPVREALALSMMMLTKSNIHVEQRLDEALPRCYAEPQLIEEVVLNLITNAASALKAWPWEKRIRVSTFLEGGEIILQVEDSGPGVPREVRDRVFEPFFTTKNNSTGIGLSLCHRIVTDHGGSIRVEEGEGGGARFVVALPLEGDRGESRNVRHGL